MMQNNLSPPLEMDPFLLSALQNPRDRMTILKLDQELNRFMNNPQQTHMEFPPMNGYQRMIVHKVAHYFGLMHTYDRQKRSVTVYKQQISRIPILRFNDLAEQPDEKQMPVKLLTRPVSKEEERLSQDIIGKEEKFVDEEYGLSQDKTKKSKKINPVEIRKVKKDLVEIASNNNTSSASLSSSPTDIAPTTVTLLASRPKTTITTTPMILKPAQPGVDGPVLKKQIHSASATQKTLEEREEAYARARARIFADSVDSKEDTLETRSEELNKSASLLKSKAEGTNSSTPSKSPTHSDDNDNTLLDNHDEDSSDEYSRSISADSSFFSSANHSLDTSPVNTPPSDGMIFPTGKKVTPINDT